jgi:anti-sigma B factor antagonist
MVYTAPKLSQQLSDRLRKINKEFRMALTAKIRKVGDVSIVDLNGRITLGENTASLREEMRSLLSQGTRKVVINMADVGYVDSAGLGELVGLYTAAANRGGSLKLLNLQGKMRDLMEITKLYTVFPVFEDEKVAVSSFDGSDKK